MSKDPLPENFTISEEERAALRAGDEGFVPPPVRVTDKRGGAPLDSSVVGVPSDHDEPHTGLEGSPDPAPLADPSPDAMEVIDLLKPGERLWIRDVLYEVKGIVPEVGPILQPVAIGRATLKALKRNERRNQQL
jgi:hypothetical protein